MLKSGWFPDGNVSGLQPAPESMALSCVIPPRELHFNESRPQEHPFGLIIRVDG
jgi:hypothetical protein